MLSLGVGGTSYALILASMVASVVYGRELEPLVNAQVILLEDALKDHDHFFDNGAAVKFVLTPTAWCRKRPD